MWLICVQLSYSTKICEKTLCLELDLCRADRPQTEDRIYHLFSAYLFGLKLLIDSICKLLIMKTFHYVK